MTTCTQCQGLMVEEHRIEMDGGDGEMWTFSLHCFSCGYQDNDILYPYHQQHTKPVAATTQTETVEAFGVPWESEEIQHLAA